ncbi:MAG: type I 3-dehydroquinate dehydratase [Syntrophales bacterium]|nr:type I 3-dehydroquinate dehydratase [Syntrophales bacterium]MDD5643737.1 type I 3-dehydroquinate dehydratase [Syntrophales bacterium]
MPDNGKRKTENGKPLRICVPVVEANVRRARNLYLRAARRGFWTELRLDYLEELNLKRLFGTRPGKVIATNRLESEGGKWQGSEGERRLVLEEALGYGVDCLDLELAADAAWRQEIWERRGASRIILSWHDFTSTPETPKLEAVLQEMLTGKGDIVKIVTQAREPADNLRVLSLIPQARAAGREIIAFCMGPAGKWSRVVAPFLGSYLTFAPFSKKGASAPGQMTVNEIRRLWKLMK